MILPVNPSLFPLIRTNKGESDMNAFTRNSSAASVNSATKTVAVLVGLLLISLSNSVLARDKATPKVYGETMGNWGQMWWQWALSLPFADNPILDDGDVDCSAGQSGKVWFLAGTFGTTANRTCDIEAGKALYVPLFNAIKWSAINPGVPDPGTPEDCSDEADCRKKASDSIDIGTWTCTLDDQPCVWTAQVVRAQSDALPLILAPGTIAVTDFGYAAGTRQISIADQYAVMFNPLSKGTHVLHYTAKAPDFALDVTYNLNVQKKKHRHHDHDHDGK
jgi:hypothetical protein